MQLYFFTVFIALGSLHLGFFIAVFFIFDIVSLLFYYEVSIQTIRHRISSPKTKHWQISVQIL